MTGQSLDVRDLRVLDDSSLADVRRLLAADPFANAMLTARVDASGTLDPGRLGGEMLAVTGSGSAVCFRGGTLLPVGGDADLWAEVGVLLGRSPRRSASIVGPPGVVGPLWTALTPRWGPARRLLADQPLLVTDRPAPVAADPRVRAVRPSELEAYLPAATAMLAEELGLTSAQAAARSSYRTHLVDSIAAGRSFLRLDRHGEVVFKAELAAVTAHTAQLQGVWVRPDQRGTGLGTTATAAVITAGLAVAPTVSLYVNDFNVAARRMYDRLKMRPAGTLSTVLF